jgi:hypothetical protein
MQGKKRIRFEAQEWYFHSLNDPNQFEKKRYIYSINVYSSVIEEFQKLYEQIPAADRTARARILWNETVKKRISKNSG